MNIDEKDEFADIRPYNASEFPAVMKRIFTSPYLIEILRKTKWPNCPRISQIRGQFPRGPLLRKAVPPD